jgi:hypothetical protein
MTAMLTPLGKAFTFFMVVFSVLALGVAMWVAADPVYVTPPGGSLTPSYKAKWDALENELKGLERDKQAQVLGVLGVMTKNTNNDRTAPFDPADPLGQARALPTVKQLKDDIRKGSEDLNTLLNTWTAKEAELATLITDLSIMRTNVRSALADQKALAEEIVPDPAKDPNKTPFREQTAAAFAAKAQSERRQDDLKPILVNETLRLMGLMKRNELLEQRAKELGGN